MFAEWVTHRKREENQLQAEREEHGPFLSASATGSPPIIALDQYQPLPAVTKHVLYAQGSAGHIMGVNAFNPRTQKEPITPFHRWGKQGSDRSCGLAASGARPLSERPHSTAQQPQQGLQETEEPQPEETAGGCQDDLQSHKQV